MAKSPRLSLNDPADCWVCKRMSDGLGLGPPDHDRWNKNPRWVCADCVPHGKEIRIVRKFDPYEKTARRDAMDKIGEFLRDIGKTDLGDFTEEQALELVTIAINEFGESLRRQVAELRAPF
jgi:hypothetical protein